MPCRLERMTKDASKAFRNKDNTDGWHKFWDELQEIQGKPSYLQVFLNFKIEITGEKSVKVYMIQLTFSLQMSLNESGANIHASTHGMNLFSINN